MEELEAGKISGVPVDEAEVYKKLGVNEEYIIQKSRACGENPQVSALFICISAQKHHDARRSK